MIYVIKGNIKGCERSLKNGGKGKCDDEIQESLNDLNNL